MKRLKTHHSTLGIFGTAAITATLLGCSAFPHIAQAAPAPDVLTSGIYVTILSPSTEISDPTKQIEISAFYEAAPITGGITTLELYIDGQQEAVKSLDSPENKGVVSFVISPGTLTPGSHHIVVRVSANDAEIASAKTNLDIAQPSSDSSNPAPALGGTTPDGSAPAVAIVTPAPDSTVVGTVDIKVDAHDDSGKSPYVSLFIDHNFKTLRNFPPYDFAWDTTRVANGFHTLEVWGYNDEQAVGHAQPLTVYVNNPSGRTTVRQDLLDTVPTQPAQKMVIRSREHTAVLPAVHHSVQRMPARLASGPAISTSTVGGLAVAKLDVTGSSISEQSLLMSPFLPTRLPQITRTPIAAPVRSMAAITADNGSTSVSTVSVYGDLTTKPVPMVMLAAPTIEKIVRTSVSAKTNGTRTAAKLVSIAASLRTAPDLSKDAQTPSLIHLESSTSPVISDDDNGPALESPNTHQMTRAVKAVLAAGQPVGNILMGATRIASASIDRSTLFTPDTALQAPVVSQTRLSRVISDHRIMTHMIALGTTSTGFSPMNVLRDEHGYQVVMNDQLVTLDQPLADRDSFLFAPFRQIFENEGGVLAWNPVAHTVHALNGSRDIELTIGSKIALVNQEEITLNACPYLERGRTMIPLAFVPIALDATVSYDPASGHIVINSKDE